MRPSTIRHRVIREMDDYDDVAKRSKGAATIDRFRNGIQGGHQSSLACYMRSDMLRDLDLFKDRNPEFVSRVIDDVDIAFFKPGDFILKQGEKADTCYILNRGEVSVQVGGNEVAKLGGGSIFGEICLLGLSQRRTASIIALSFCDIRVVHQDKFQYALKRFPKERHHFHLEAQRRMAEIAKMDQANAPKPVQKQRRASSSRIPPKLQASDFDCDGNIPARRGSHADALNLMPTNLDRMAKPGSSRRRSVPSIVGNVLQNVAEKCLANNNLRSVLCDPAPGSVGKDEAQKSLSQTECSSGLDPSLAELMCAPLRDTKYHSNSSGFSDSSCKDTGAMSGAEEEVALQEREKRRDSPREVQIKKKLEAAEKISMEDIMIRQNPKGIGPSTSSTSNAADFSTPRDPPQRRRSTGSAAAQMFSPRPPVAQNPRRRSACAGSLEKGAKATSEGKDPRIARFLDLLES